MSYAQYGKIEYTDYNTLVGTTTDTTANRLNSVLGPGSGSYGYGQTAINQVAQHGTVTAAQWASLINTTASQRLPHYIGTDLTTPRPIPTPVSSPISGTLISWRTTYET